MGSIRKTRIKNPIEVIEDTVNGKGLSFKKTETDWGEVGKRAIGTISALAAITTATQKVTRAENIGMDNHANKKFDPRH